MGADADRDAQILPEKFTRVQRAMRSGTRWRKAAVRRRTPGRPARRIVCPVPGRRYDAFQ